ncbi:hypothetical protein N7481_001392 [Penicillium waksmanii]|uniref:uncharacterized protein n=1 Tax=Penicillium waksmanii TaxID=69791 RepID=UPI002548E451|nr:uncharacterized protein N7481_001392 [Penicillium waksmanii]KAJ6000983.1 hypothetical protein N7481_001392 [Penicillium waksmanii]
MATLPIKTVGVIGTGVIGASWTALFLAKGLQVIVSDPAPRAEERLRSYLEKEWPTMSKVGLSPGASLKNYEFVDDISDHLGRLDFIQENGPERLDFKRSLFAHLDANTREHIILASSSSGLPSSEFITDCQKNPARILIGHPFNPPHLVPLVEVVPHPRTGAQYVTGAMGFYQSMGKDTVLVKQEVPGFIANRLQAAVCGEAYSLISRGIISAQDLDKTVTSGIGLRWAFTGPIMTNVLGGGGDFRHLLEHLGPASRAWTEDMRNHEFDFNSESLDALNGSVQEWVSKVDVETEERKRDNSMLALIKDKSNDSV